MPPCDVPCLARTTLFIRLPAGLDQTIQETQTQNGMQKQGSGARVLGLEQESGLGFGRFQSGEPGDMDINSNPNPDYNRNLFAAERV